MHVTCSHVLFTSVEVCTTPAVGAQAQGGKDCSHSLAGPAGDVPLVLRSREVKLCTPCEG